MLSRPALHRPAAAKRRGFTLLELIVVLLILGILAAIAIPTFNRIQENSVRSSLNTDAEAIARNANGIASSGNSGVVSDEILNRAALEAYGGAEDANGNVTSVNDADVANDGIAVTIAASNNNRVVISKRSGSITCVVYVEAGAGEKANQAVVTWPTNAAGSANCPDQTGTAPAE